MPWDIQYQAGKQTLVVTTRGPMSDEEANELAAKAIALLKETHATRILSDCRRMAPAPSLATVWWMVHGYSHRGLPRETRIAVVQPRSRRAAELGEFYETVCYNRNYQAKTFSSPTDAEAWLQSPRSA